MKTNTLLRGISFLLLLLLVACQTPTATLAPVTVTPLPPLPKTETPPVVSVATSTAMVAPTATELKKTPGEIAYAHVESISEGIGPRVAGTAAETQAAQYIILEFERLGYASELRPFPIKRNVNSANIIAVKPGDSLQEIIVGAHYDSVKVGKGADDNATSVGVILEVAERLRNKDTPYTIRFILFGAEELNLAGSSYYVSRMREDEIQNTIAMINLDSLTAGDLAYIYGDQGKKGIIRDWALNFAKEHNLTLQTQPGENPKYPAGTTGDWSDHAPFKKVGIPYTYFESTNWTLGNKDGYTQVSAQYGENGEIWHTQYDTLEYINATFPGRMQERLNLYVTLLEAILTQFELPK